MLSQGVCRPQLTDYPSRRRPVAALAKNLEGLMTSRAEARRYDLVGCGCAVAPGGPPDAGSRKPEARLGIAVNDTPARNEVALCDTECYGQKKWGERHGAHSSSNCLCGNVQCPSGCRRRYSRSTKDSFWRLDWP